MPRTFYYKNSKRLKEVRQFLRAEPVLAEKILWKYLRREQLGYKFRRQFSINNRVFDFCCEPLKLVIELDGWTHDSEKTGAKDGDKQKMVEAVGYRVIRFANEQVYGDIEPVINEIKRVCVERVQLLSPLH